MKIFIPILFLLFCISIEAQETGGRNAFPFLRTPTSAHITSLGGVGVSIKENRPNFIFQNPALIDSSMTGQLDLDYLSLFGQARVGTISKVFSVFDRHVGLGIHYFNYGNFQRTDESGVDLGEFSAQEYQVLLGTSHQLYDKVRLGASVKFIGSHLADYQAFGLAADLGATYQLDSAGNSFFALTFQNIGYPISYYEGVETRQLPFNISLGLTRRLKYLPFRYTITYQNAQVWNVLYDDPNTVENEILFGDQSTERPDVEVFADNLFRHLVFSGEFLFGKSEKFRLRAAFDYRKRAELESETLRSLAGISFGFGIHLKRFTLDFGKSFYHQAGGTNHLSLGLNL